MASSNLRKGLKRTALSVALGMCFAGTAYAQSNNSGAIAGQAVAGSTVIIESAATGFHREVPVGADGNYRVSALQTGTYTVTVKNADGTMSPARTVTVSIGGTSNATVLDAVSVIGGSRINTIDVSSVESTTVLTSEQIAKIPVPRDITAVALLAPGTVRGDAAFGDLASFGGSSVAENAYFVNGFNITNAFKNLNFGQIPFEAIAEQQVKTGGYGAEFGRSTGGVINIVTKRGSNEFHAGGSIYVTPDSLRGTNPNVYANNGALLSNNSKDTFDGSNTTSAVWASGALIPDRLFAYALFQYSHTTSFQNYGSISSAFNRSGHDKSPTWLVKLDWNINDNHLLEFTSFSDITRTTTDVFTTLDDSEGIGRGPLKGTVFDKEGGQSYALKYTGYLTDNFTLTALAGHGESSRSNFGIAANGIREQYDGNVNGTVSGCPVITDIRVGVDVGDVPAISGCNFFPTGLIGSTKAEDQRDQFRIDLEWQLGDHLLRGGIDIDQFESFDAESLEGGVSWRYQGDPEKDEKIVRKRVFKTGAGVEVDSEAFYIEDRWQVTDNFMAYGGLRWDSFENKNGVGETFVKIDNQFGPRLGFSWDVNGDQKFKVFGNAGRYALPLTATVAVRGASASLFTQQFFTYTDIDPVTGAPLPAGLVKIDEVAFLNNEFGLAKNAKSIASDNLEPMYQDEYILGFQAQLTDNLSGGVRGIYRDLKRAIDDQCDSGPIFEFARANGIDENPQNPGFAYCHLYNPGSDGEFNVDIDGDGVLEHVHVDADVLGPKAKRTYKAVEFFAEGHWDKFFLQGSYTWSKSEGNTEGGVKSDIGQDDTGTTQDFDYPQLMIGADGPLPNDRRHSFKLFGNYQFNDEWSMGGNVLLQSGRPINCIGIFGDDPVHYGASYFSCDTGAPDDFGDNGSTIVPRGSRGRTPWNHTLDLNVTYRPSAADGHLTLKMDVFNVFNRHSVTSVSEAGEDGAGIPLFSTTYKVPLTFQDARAIRFLVQYDY